MSGFASSIVGGIGNLIRTYIRSPNYVAGVSGWTINQDGSAEFNNVRFRGTIVISQTGEELFVYNGTPATGNLILSISSTSGFDSYGNQYLAGLALTDNRTLGQYFPQHFLDASGNTTGTIGQSSSILGALAVSSPTIILDALQNIIGIANYGILSGSIPIDASISNPNQSFIQHGSSATATDGSGYRVITFPTSFTATPQVFITCRNSSGSQITAVQSAISTNSVTIRLFNGTSAAAGSTSASDWIAIGH